MTATHGQKVNTVARAVIGSLFGLGSNTYRDITVSANPDSHRTGAIAATMATNGLVVTELVPHR